MERIAEVREIEKTSAVLVIGHQGGREDHTLDLIPGPDDGNEALLRQLRREPFDEIADADR